MEGRKTTGRPLFRHQKARQPGHHDAPVRQASRRHLLRCYVPHALSVPAAWSHGVAYGMCVYLCVWTYLYFLCMSLIYTLRIQSNIYTVDISRAAYRIRYVCPFVYVNTLVFFYISLIYTVRIWSHGVAYGMCVYLCRWICLYFSIYL